MTFCVTLVNYYFRIGNCKIPNPIESQVATETLEAASVPKLKIRKRMETFQCIYCIRNYSKKSSLDRHVDMHTHLTGFWCSRCRKPFRSNTSLYKHSKTSCQAKGLGKRRRWHEQVGKLAGRPTRCLGRCAGFFCPGVTNGRLDPFLVVD